MTTVTPPLRSITEPTAPRHGPSFDDEPYLRRRSTRLRSLRTPSPGHEKHNKQTIKNHPRNYQSQHNLSPPSSPVSPNRSPIKRKSKRDIQKTNQDSVHRNLAPDDTQMLPTPVKTPAKPEKKRISKSASRILFPHGLRNNIEDIMPQRNRTSLYSPGSAPEVQIYTDTDAQIPELDESEENVFYDPPHRRNTRVNTRAKEMGATNDKRKELEKHKDADKGMWFTFRGKKVWREYQGEEQDDYPEGAVITGHSSLKRKTTPPPKFIKTAYKPRTLFPEANKRGDTTDEEAVTDIEHPEKYDFMHEDITQEKPAATPAKQRFYATPPTTVRTTRSTAKRPADDTSLEIDELSTSLFTVKKGKRTSPFNEWTRVKGDGGGESQEKKRKADQALHPDNSKRARSDISD